MRIRRRLPIFLGVVLVAAAVALVVVLRKHAPPEPARLLPGADGFVYINLKWMRRADVIGQLPPVPHDPEYEQFIDATGFQFERDLDEAAFAVHYPTGTAPVAENAPQFRFSEVFVGKIQGDRLSAYLKKLAVSIEDHQSINIYNIPLQGRTVRVAILGVDTIAASNNDDPQVIRGIIDRSRKLASPFAGPALLRQYYKEIPLASLAWAILKVNPSNDVTAGPGLSFLFSRPAMMVASLRYLGAVHFRAVAFTDSEDEAGRVAERVGNFLSLFHSAENTVAPAKPDPDVNQLFDSLKVERDKNRATLTATLPLGFIRKALAEAPGEVTPSTSDGGAMKPDSQKARQR